MTSRRNEERQINRFPFLVFISFLFISNSVFADRYGFEDDFLECEALGECPSFGDLFEGFFYFIVLIFSVKFLRKISEGVALILFQSIIFYLCYLGWQQEKSLFMLLVGFLSVEFFFLFIWENTKDR